MKRQKNKQVRRMGNCEMLASYYQGIFGKKIQLNTIMDRIILQKIVVIGEALGLKFGEYDYSWYVHGPYSSSLTVDAYEIATSKKDYATYGFGDREREKIELIKEKFKKEIEDMDSIKFELYGSIVFCIRQGIERTEEITKEIKARKPWYTEKDILEGIRKIRGLKQSA
jgi:uncharacterized protein YwgA